MRRRRGFVDGLGVRGLSLDLRFDFHLRELRGFLRERRGFLRERRGFLLVLLGVFPPVDVVLPLDVLSRRMRGHTLEVSIPGSRRDGGIRPLIVRVHLVLRFVLRFVLVVLVFVVFVAVFPGGGASELIPTPRGSGRGAFAILLVAVFVRGLVLLLVVLFQQIVDDHGQGSGPRDVVADRGVLILVLVLVVGFAELLLHLALLVRDVGELEDGAALLLGARTLGDRRFGWRCGLQGGDGLDHRHARRHGGCRGDGGDHRRGLRHPEPDSGGSGDGGDDDGLRGGIGTAAQRVVVVILVVVVVVHAPASAPASAPAHRHHLRALRTRGCHHRGRIHGCHDRDGGSLPRLLILVHLIVIVVLLELGEHVGAARRPSPGYRAFSVRRGLGQKPNLEGLFEKPTKQQDSLRFDL